MSTELSNFRLCRGVSRYMINLFLHQLSRDTGNPVVRPRPTQPNYMAKELLDEAHTVVAALIAAYLNPCV